MNKLIQTNCFDTAEKMVVMGTCLKQMQPRAYEEVLRISENIYEVCLEEIHMNMIVTKLIGMIARKNIKELYFVTVDKSPHCVQLHYVVKELQNAMNLKDIKITNYIAENNQLVEIPIEVISLSKNLGKLKRKWEESKFENNRNI